METPSLPRATCIEPALHRKGHACTVSVQPPADEPLGLVEAQNRFQSCKRPRRVRCRSPSSSLPPCISTASVGSCSPSESCPPSEVYRQPVLLGSSADDATLLAEKADAISPLLFVGPTDQQTQEEQTKTPTDLTGKNGVKLSSSLLVPSFGYSKAGEGQPQITLNSADFDAAEDMSKWTSGQEAETDKYRSGGDASAARQQLDSYRHCAAAAAAAAAAAGDDGRLAEHSVPSQGDEGLRNLIYGEGGGKGKTVQEEQQKQEKETEKCWDMQQGRADTKAEAAAETAAAETAAAATAAATTTATAAVTAAATAAATATAIDNQEKLESLFRATSPTYEDELGPLHACSEPQSQEMKLARTVVLICLRDLRDSCIPEVYVHPMDRQAHVVAFKRLVP
ncbi:hypothetical protein, conserved [Eimeria praecox]|uniref:Uncharacterized protein n=1 Tax=Eimeria praecox TaxID=51316 RepID=U6H5J1_9EIME|nr:hypothetical protein, conserved [Eimeria praecox]